MPKNDSYAVYMKIYYQIIEDIIQKKYGPYNPLPTQNELAERFGVSRVTIREAIKELCRRGIVRTVKGKGTFVTIQPSILSGAEREKGLSTAREMNLNATIKSKTIQTQIIPATDFLAEKLLVKKYSLLTFIKRVRYVKSQPACLDNVYLVNDRLNGINLFEEKLDSGSLYKILRTKGNVEFDLIEDQFRAISCPDEVSQLLGILPGEPVINMIRISYDQLGRPVEFCNNYERSDIYYTKIYVKNERRTTTESNLQNKWITSMLCAAIASQGDTSSIAQIETYCLTLLQNIEDSLTYTLPNTSTDNIYAYLAIHPFLLDDKNATITSSEYLSEFLTSVLHLFFQPKANLKTVLTKSILNIAGIPDSYFKSPKEKETLTEILSHLVQKNEEGCEREEIIHKVINMQKNLSPVTQSLSIALAAIAVHPGELMPVIYLSKTLSTENTPAVLSGMLSGALYGNSILPSQYMGTFINLVENSQSIHAAIQRYQLLKE